MPVFSPWKSTGHLRGKICFGFCGSRPSLQGVAAAAALLGAADGAGRSHALPRASGLRRLRRLFESAIADREDLGVRLLHANNLVAFSHAVP